LGRVVAKTDHVADFMGMKSSQKSQFNISHIADKVDSSYTWKDIVLPSDILVVLKKFCQQVAHLYRLLEEHKLARDKGVIALFIGPPGTAKTMAAKVIANDLGLDLYRINLSGVVSKYIGETEKNLEKVFSRAENMNCVLLFDEADELFGKSGEVKDNHDRYDNIKINFILQKIEQYRGAIILCANSDKNLNEAFVHRMDFVVQFPFPGRTTNT
jgi:SpoVK/Ycf46/Vps4 family AAA+-type ATPase